MAAKIKIDGGLYDRVKKVADLAGYASADEFIVHMIEKELAKLETAESDEEVTELAPYCLIDTTSPSPTGLDDDESIGIETFDVQRSQARRRIVSAIHRTAAARVL